MAEFLGDTPIFQQTMSESERNEFSRFKEVTPMPKTIDQPIIADFPTEFVDKPAAKPTTKKTTTRKTTAKKETAVKKTIKTAAKPTTEPKGNPQDKIAAVKADYECAVAKAKTLGVTPKFSDDPKNFVTGNGVTRDKEQIERLLIVAAVEGYDRNEWATFNQIKANGGKLKADAYGAPMFMPLPNGKEKYYKVYNIDAVDWEDGKMPNTFRKTQPRKTAAKKPVRKAPAKKPAATKANNAELEALKKENAELKKTLDSIAANQESTAAVLAALVAKLGI